MPKREQERREAKRAKNGKREREREMRNTSRTKLLPFIKRTNIPARDNALAYKKKGKESIGSHNFTSLTISLF